MSVQSGPSRFRSLFESALQDYENVTSVTLAKHPLAEQLQNCHSVESITALLQDQARALTNSRGGDGSIMKLLKGTVSTLYTLSASTVLGQAIGLPFPPAQAVFSGIAILLGAVKDVGTSFDALVDLLESIERFLKRLDIYTQIPPTPAIDEMAVKIMVELLSTLALATKELKQGRPKKFVKKLFGDKEVEATLERLDRLTQDEARTTAAEILKVVYGLVRDLNGKASVDSIREALEILHQIASDVNKSKRDKLQNDIRSWLCPPDPWKNHHVACESHQRGTGAWFVQGDMFSKWKSSGPSSLLWIQGKPGAGKSVFCSTIIEDIDSMRKRGLASLAFFYHDFREDAKKELRGLLSSVLFQLGDQSDSYYDILADLYSRHRRGAKSASDDELARCLKDILKLPGQAPVYLIVDALDECPDTSAKPSHREKVLMLVEKLIDSRLPNLRICVTSRPEADIKAILEPISLNSISLHEEVGQLEDIDSYIMSEINMDPKNRRWKSEDKRLVIEVLKKKADGMFRWVYCQVVYLRGCHPGRIRQALAELPETLDETYERTLGEIKKTDWELAHRLFQCIAVASRPLGVEELAEFLAFDFEAGPVPKFHEDWRMEDPMDAVLSTCSTLLAIVNVDDSRVVQFSHFSVKEFLMSTRFAEKCDTISRRFHVSMTHAHTLVAQACLGMLLHLDENVTRDSLGKFSLAEYAAEHWVDHARVENVSENVEEEMKQLFHPRRPHLAVWVWIWDPCRSRKPTERTQRPLPPSGSPLHYAALCGFYAIVEFLVIEHTQDVDSQGFDEESTPLHLASQRGSIEVAQFLIDHGADATAQDNNGWTPLHHASSKGSVEIASLLVDHGADATAQDKYRQSPLYHASTVEFAQFLVDHSADMTARDQDGRTPLHWASNWRGVEVARWLVDHGADPTAQDKYGQTPLHWASSVEVAQFLVDHGADPTALDKHGRTTLHLPSSMEVARFLVDHGVDATAEDKCGSTALHWAISVEVARFLVDHGADVTAQGKRGWTPLHGASNLGLVEVARFLVDHGADPTAVDKYGQTTMHRVSSAEVARFLVEHGVDATAQDNKRLTALHHALGVEVARFLVEHGADVTAQDKRGSTPLHWASAMGRVEIARFLIEHGADVTARNHHGSTPLHHGSTPLHRRWTAPISESLGIIRLLIDHGADATAQDNHGFTPLHLASKRGSVKVARFFVNRCADVTAQQDRHGRTPLHLASRGGHVEVARLLVEHGADLKAQDKEGSSPLHLASRGGHVAVARILLQSGADPTAQNKLNLCPSQLASVGGCRRIVQLLARHGGEE